LSDPSAVLLFTSYHVIVIQDLPHYANRAGEIEDKTRDHARDFDAVALWRLHERITSEADRSR
jgi:hypothetical protein